MPEEVEISPLDPARFRSVLPPERFDELRHEAEERRRLLDGHVIWNVNATAKGGGVVELCVR